MYSLQDVFSLEELAQWCARIDPTDELPMTAEVKVDGLAISLTYLDGVLTQAPRAEMGVWVKTSLPMPALSPQFR